MPSTLERTYSLPNLPCSFLLLYACPCSFPNPGTPTFQILPIFKDPTSYSFHQSICQSVYSNIYWASKWKAPCLAERIRRRAGCVKMTSSWTLLSRVLYTMFSSKSSVIDWLTISASHHLLTEWWGARLLKVGAALDNLTHIGHSTYYLMQSYRGGFLDESQL